MLSDPSLFGAQANPLASSHTSYRRSARATCLCKWPPPPCSAPYNTWLPPSCVQAAAVQPAAPLPDWAKPLDREGPSRDEAFAYNRRVVADANAERRQLDFVLWGDSLTSNLQSKYPQTWDEWFGQYDAAPLGVSASTVEELAWRIMSGRERFDVGPRVRQHTIRCLCRLATAGRRVLHC